MTADRLQTDPYLTLTTPGSRPVVYPTTDTREVSWPDTDSAPADAVFGVIGLDRQVSWSADLHELEVLREAARRPADTSTLRRRFGAEVIDRLSRRRWLLPPEDLCRDYLLRTAQIEITAHCNWGCEFCPVARDPKPRETMTLDLFTEIIEKLCGYETINFVTFHFYNEPTLDHHFEERLEVLRRYGRKLSLSTNGTGLTQSKIDALSRTGVLHHLAINLPSLDEAEFVAMTGSKTQHISLRNLDAAIDAGLPITILVNGVGPDLRRNVARLAERFEPRGVEVRPTLTCDRAGNVEGQYDQKIDIRGRLRGCAWPVNHAHFSVRGDMFVCCNDYYQREKFGNVRDGSVHEVMTSPAAIALRRRVFGVDPAPDNYLCRSCHDQLPDFARREYRPIASFPLLDVSKRIDAAGREPGT